MASCHDDVDVEANACVHYLDTIGYLRRRHLIRGGHLFTPTQHVDASNVERRKRNEKNNDYLTTNELVINW